jgi:hypothetical protein
LSFEETSKATERAIEDVKYLDKKCITKQIGINSMLIFAQNLLINVTPVLILALRRTANLVPPEKA